MPTSSSSNDPYILGEYFPNQASYPINGGNYNLSGKTPVAIDTSKNICCLVVFGESHSSNVSPTAYTPSNSNVNNLCIYNGAQYSAVDPLLGCSNALSPLGPGNLYSRLGNTIQGGGKFDQTMLVTAGIGGSTMAMWSVDQFNRIFCTFSRLSSRSISPTAVLLHIGSNDCALGTSQASFSSSLSSFITLIRSKFSGPIFIAKNTWYSGNISTGIQASQTGAVDHSSGIWLLGDADSLNATYRQADNIHFNDLGATSFSALAYLGLQAYGAPFI